MPVADKHPAFLANEDQWKKCRDTISGQEAVREAGTSYLPKLDGMSSDEYAAYKQRAMFFNATARSLDAFIGMLFRTDATEEIPNTLEQAGFDLDADLEGQDWDEYCKMVARDVVGLGRCGTWVDWSSEESRPLAVFYRTEQVINWRTTRWNGKVILSMVVLHEQVDGNVALPLSSDLTKDGHGTATTSAVAPTTVLPGTMTGGSPMPTGRQATALPSGDDFEFDVDMVDQWRVLKLNLDGATPVYEVDIWREDKVTPASPEKKYKLVATYQPRRRAQAIDSIPFVFHGAENNLPAVGKPPLMDLVEVNLSHYRTSADLEHGRHFTGLPTPFIAGMDPNGAEIKLGSSTCIVVKDPQAKATMLEFTGSGLQTLEKAMEQKEHQMAILGARMLETPKRATETVEAIMMKQSGEQSALGSIALVLSDSLGMVLRWALYWTLPPDKDFASTQGQAEVFVNADFDSVQMPAQMVLAVIAAVGSRLLSRESAVEAFKRGELVSDKRDAEEELELIDSEKVPLEGEPVDLQQQQQAAGGGKPGGEPGQEPPGDQQQQGDPP